MLTNRIPYKEARYVLPLIVLPFLLFLGYQVLQFVDREEVTPNEDAELSTSFGEAGDPILSKNDAYDAFFKNGDGFFSVDSREKKDSLKEGEEIINPFEEADQNSVSNANGYTPNEAGSRANTKDAGQVGKESDKQLPQNSQEFFRLFNEKALGKAQNSTPSGVQNTNLNLANTEKTKIAVGRKNITVPGTPIPPSKISPSAGNLIPAGSAKNRYEKRSDFATNVVEYAAGENTEQRMDPIQILRSQMLVMDSLEKSRDPEFQAESRAQKKLLEHKEKLNKFLSSTLRVSKTSHNPNFNAVYKQSESFFIKAVIDEDLSGFLGSRIRLRLLEDIFVGNKKLLKGQILYAQVSGFSFERVQLSIVSVLVKEEILPIHLTLYDLDGQKGLYVPGSEFRNMMKELSSSSVQGQNLDSADPSFYSSLLSTAFRSASQSAAKLLRTNKAKLKYGTQVLLFEEAH